MSDWRDYERFVAKLMSDYASNDFTVIPNAKLLGSISNVERQIDVLIDAKWDNNTCRRIIVDAKRYKNKIDVKDVEMFEGMMKDCRAQHGILVCPNGYTPAAKKRAQEAITIKLIPLDELGNLDLKLWDQCLGRCSSGKTSQHGLVLYDSPYGWALFDSPLSISAVGKCDVCNQFHVWCWECGQKFALQNEDDHQCDCADRFWLTSIESDIDEEYNSEVHSVYLFLIFTSGRVIPVDRIKLT
jgi:hypothetical protein